ncbi:MAG TPA: acetyl-CoA carboxylase biotin carboxyl carrier protein [Longimicrobiaceae bacterium]|nr:acetyl-CoA carboxylase biotin carboxyl carrier protein [Longimicrobiaceae bacterium]
MIDLEFLRGLIGAVDQSGIDSLEISRGGTRIRIAKTPPPVLGTASAPQPSAPAAVAQLSTPVAAPAPSAVRDEGAPAGLPSTPTRPNWIEVKSPMVGTFYRAPTPEAPPYVEIGTRVSKGQTLCILEAMKLMNELEAEVSGIVREIAIENGQPVEYGQVLFRIEAD